MQKNINHHFDYSVRGFSNNIFANNPFAEKKNFMYFFGYIFFNFYNRISINIYYLAEHCFVQNFWFDSYL